MPGLTLFLFTFLDGLPFWEQAIFSFIYQDCIMFRNPFQPLPTHQSPAQEPAASPSPEPGPWPWQTVNESQEDAERRLDAMERDEPKRRLIRDAKALAKCRGITQAQMAEEIGVPHRTLEDWLQFRRTPKAPGTTLLRRWVTTHTNVN